MYNDKKKTRVSTKGGRVTSRTTRGSRADDPSAGKETEVNAGSLTELAALAKKRRKKDKKDSEATTHDAAELLAKRQRERKGRR